MKSARKKRSTHATTPAPKPKGPEPGMAGRGRVRDWRERARDNSGTSARTELLARILDSPGDGSDSLSAGEPDERLGPSWAHRRQPPPIVPFEPVECAINGPAPKPSPHRTLRTPSEDVLVRPDLASRLQRRQNYWDAFTAATREAQDTHRAISPDVALYWDAKSDKSLQELGFRVVDGAASDLASQALVQQVPERDGAAIGSLFDSTRLNLSRRDNSAVRSIQGRADVELDRVMNANNDLDAILRRVSAAAGAVKAATARQAAALYAIQHNIAKNEAEDAREIVERRRAAIGDLVSTVNVIGATMTGILQAAAGNLPETFEQIGIVASSVFSQVTDPRLRSAEVRLKSAKKTMRLTREKQLEELYLAAQMDVESAFDTLASERSRLRAAIGKRQVAFAEAGVEAASEARGPSQSKSKIAAIIAAIPRVEIVVARVDAIAARAHSPTPTQFARRGLGMALYHQRPEVGPFLRVCGELNHEQQYFASIADEWRSRLGALNRVKERIEGRRPGGDR